LRLRADGAARVREMLAVGTDARAELRARPRSLADELEGRLACRPDLGDRDPARALEALDEHDAPRVAWADCPAKIGLAAPAHAAERDRVLHSHDDRRLGRDAREAGLV